MPRCAMQRRGLLSSRLEQGLNNLLQPHWGTLRKSSEGCYLGSFGAREGRREGRGVDAPCRRQFNARSLQVLAYQGTNLGAVQTPLGRCTKSRVPGHQLWVSWCPGLEGL